MFYDVSFAVSTFGMLLWKNHAFLIFYDLFIGCELRLEIEVIELWGCACAEWEWTLASFSLAGFPGTQMKTDSDSISRALEM